jgi:prepilin-type N-terminal cleavage/methylation domain-containing protein
MGNSENTAVHKKLDYPQDVHRVVASSRGYTLVELILVMVLIAVVSVVAIPKFFDTTAISIEGAAGMIAADIRYTQELAMGTHQDKQVVFAAVDDKDYTVDSRTVNFPSNVSILIPQTFTFNSLGEPIAGGGSCVEIQAGCDCKKICVENYTGRVSVVYPCTDPCP